VTLKQVNDCVKEAHRFLDKARAVVQRVDENETAFYGCKETAALRRASLDLTRALADLRRA
jgi:hypothetical protein